ncbi:MAG TPA: hypothetical protein ENJ31_11070 [Anaerolineae bacterium]|nr:hypothetical protein [Anaerolineae bacterium]
MNLDSSRLALLQEFEHNLDPQRPEDSPIPARILGYGEISTVFEIQDAAMDGLAFKRLPLFEDEVEIARYRAVYDEYLRLLADPIGLHLPPHGQAVVRGRSGKPVFYIIQRRLPGDSIGHQALRRLPPPEVNRLVRRALREMHKVWAFNRQQSALQVALDGQISNWAIEGFDPAAPHLPDARLWYLDTSTPLFRRNGVEQLDVELFLRSAPSFLVWILRLLFLQDVVDRYYDPHLVAVDLVANFYKEQRPELIPQVTGVVNDFFRQEAADLDIAPIREEEIRAYYREDALIWTLYLAMRWLDQFLRVRVLHREYPYILPRRIER